MTSNPIKCPFCQWPAMAMLEAGEWAVYCNNDGTTGSRSGACNARGPTRQTEDEAITAWNIRSRPPLPGIEGLVERARTLSLGARGGNELRVGLNMCAEALDDSADAIESLAASREEMRVALEPFAKCCDQIADDERDEEWAKFRLLVANYRRARKAYLGEEGE